MGTVFQRPYGFQIRITHKLLPKDLWATFDTRDAAEQYMHQLEALLAQGIVPQSLLERPAVRQEIWTVRRCVIEYVRHNPVPLSDRKLLDTVLPSVATIATSDLNYEWAEAWISEMKRVKRLAPSTIRHRHGALARCLDWMLRKHPEKLVQNPLRLLKRGFATYTDADADVLAKRGLDVRVDEERDRRLFPDEEERILSLLQDLVDERAFFELARDTAMRMRECYTLDISQVILTQRTIHLDRTKNGDRRQVPLPSPTVVLLRDYIDSQRDAIAARDGRLFPFWNGDRDEAVLDETTRELSLRYAGIFDAAGAGDFHFHDLRHEATCRLFQKTTLRDTEIAKITGHKDPRQLKRYASLRGSDLASQLW
ncbi:MAG: site-specific integrase [Telluria sp.]